MEAKLESGLIVGHAYGVSRVYEVSWRVDTAWRVIRDSGIMYPVHVTVRDSIYRERDTVWRVIRKYSEIAHE